MSGARGADREGPGAGDLGYPERVGMGRCSGTPDVVDLRAGSWRNEHRAGILSAVDVRSLYLFEHAHVHSRAVAHSEIVNTEDLIYDGVPDATVRACPDEQSNSMLWLCWHMARCEDVGINVMLNGDEQVFDDRWAHQMGIPERDMGTGMSMDDVRRLSRDADVDAVRRYRQAVGTRTREVIDRLDFDHVDDPLPAERLDRVRALSCLCPAASWVLEFWRPQRLRFFLWLGTGHNYMHLQEASVTRSRLGTGLGL